MAACVLSCNVQPQTHLHFMVLTSVLLIVLLFPLNGAHISVPGGLLFPLPGAHISVADCPTVSGWQAGLIQALAKLVKQGGLGSQVREAVSEALKHLTASSQKNRDTLVAAQVLPLIIAHLQTGDHNQLMRCKHAALLPCRIWPGLSTKATAVLPRCWSISAYLHAVLLVHCACYQRCGLCIGSSPHVKLKGAVLPWYTFFVLPFAL